MTRAEAAVSWTRTLLQRHVRVLYTFPVVREFREFVIHVGRAEIKLFDFAVIGTGLGYPDLVVAFVDRCWEDLVAVRTDASGFSDQLSLVSF